MRIFRELNADTKQRISQALKGRVFKIDIKNLHIFRQ